MCAIDFDEYDIVTPVEGAQKKQEKRDNTIKQFLYQGQNKGIVQKRLVVCQKNFCVLL